MGWLRYQIHSEDFFTCQPVVLFRYTSKHDYSFHLLTFVAKWQLHCFILSFCIDLESRLD